MDVVSAERLKLWSEEPAARPDWARIRARIGGLHCSLCIGTIERALGRLSGVEKVAVSLTHEQALVEYDPHRIGPEAVLQTLRDIGYTIHDPRKLRAFEEEEADLVREGRRFVVAVAFSLAAIALIANWHNPWSSAIAGTAVVSLIAFVALTLSSRGSRVAFGTAAALAATVAALAVARSAPTLAASIPAIVAGLALPPVTGCEAVAGKGVVARLDGEELLVGNPRFLAERGLALDPVEARVATLEAAGRTVVGVAKNSRLLGLLALGDRVRPEARGAVAALARAGVAAVLVTGDNERAARRVAEDVGIVRVHAGLLPGDKAQLVRRLQGQGKVAMVGDGINDAPALMQADVGLAMGRGTDIAIDSADIVILSNRLDAVPAAREVSRWSYRKLMQNVSLAFLFNGIGIPLAATGVLYPVWISWPSSTTRSSWAC
ncbi:MAG: heavy metal translocating P-type ATPase [Pseudomonadota bacterium]|jgi:cation transport ATPase